MLIQTKASAEFLLLLLDYTPLCEQSRPHLESMSSLSPVNFTGRSTECSLFIGIGVGADDARSISGLDQLNTNIMLNTRAGKDNVYDCNFCLFERPLVKTMHFFSSFMFKRQICVM